MDLLSFIASIVGSAAWPGAVVFIAYLFREPLGSVIRGLTKAKYKDLELEFGRELEKLKARADAAALPEPAPSPEPSPGTRQLPTGADLAALAELSPRAVVADSWRNVEHALDDYFARLGTQRPQSYQGMIRVLRTKHPSIQQALGLLGELRMLRNQAVHAREFDLGAQEALEFAALAQRVAATFAQASTEDYPR